MNKSIDTVENCEKFFNGWPNKFGGNDQKGIYFSHLVHEAPIKLGINYPYNLQGLVKLPS